MHIFEKNIKDLDLIIPDMATPIANYVPYKISGNTLYISGQAPVKDGVMQYVGKVGKDISINEGIKAAELCSINVIAALKKCIEDDWDKLDCFVIFHSSIIKSTSCPYREKRVSQGTRK